MQISDSGLMRVRKPQVHEQVNRRIIQTLAERLFRKNLAAQYVASDHGFLATEGGLVGEAVGAIRKQLMGVATVHLTLAGIHLLVMDAAMAEVRGPSVEDVDEETLLAAVDGVEKDSLDLLAALALPE